MTQSSHIFQKRFGLMKNPQDFFYRFLVPEDFDQANQLVLFFLTQSPTCKGFNFPPKEAEVISKWYLDNYLCNNVSFGAFEKSTKHMVAIILLEQRCYGTQFMPASYPKEYAMKLRLRNTIEGDSISGKPAELGSFIDGVLVSVDPKYFGYRIAPELQLMSLELGRSLGCIEARAALSSNRSLRATLKYSNEVESIIKLTEYVDSELGIKPYEDAKPPNDIYYYVSKKINSSNL